MRTKLELGTDLRTMLRDTFRAKGAGEGAARFARVQGYVDGYMRALLDAELFTKTELLAMVTAERVVVDGPALREVAASPPDLEESAEICAA